MVRQCRTNASPASLIAMYVAPMESGIAVLGVPARTGIAVTAGATTVLRAASGQSAWEKSKAMRLAILDRVPAIAPSAVPCPVASEPRVSRYGAIAYWSSWSSPVQR